MSNKKKIVATVEARMTSTRLPGKVIKKVGDITLLEVLISRLKRVPQLDDIVVATTINDTDLPIIELCKKLEIKYFRGSEHDVLLRVLQAAKMAKAEIIVEITGDCPLIDPEITSQVIDLYLMNKCDYASNLDPDSYPIGFDVQVFSTKVLEIAEREGVSQMDREHVSYFIRKRPDRFKKLHLHAPPELQWPDLAITLDEYKDYILIKKIYESLSIINPNFTCLDVVRFIRENPKLIDINKDVQRTII